MDRNKRVSIGAGECWQDTFSQKYPTSNICFIHLDGTKTIVISDDGGPLQINAHGDWLVYHGDDLITNRLRMTVMKTDGTERRDC